MATIPIPVPGSADGELTAVGQGQNFQPATDLIAGHYYVVNDVGLDGGTGRTLADPWLNVAAPGVAIGAPGNPSAGAFTFNDDSGIGFNSQVAFRATNTGRYTFQGTSFGLAGLGTYTLTIRDLGTSGNAFEPPVAAINNYGVTAGGWTSQNLYPRTLGFFVNPSGLQNGLQGIVGFGENGVYWSRPTGDGTTFSAPALVLSGAYGRAPGGAGSGGGGWSSQNEFPRQAANVVGNELDDIVGFGSSGFFFTENTTNPVTPNTGAGSTPTFGATTLFPFFGQSAAAGGWVSQNQYPRFVEQVNGGGREDIVGFGDNGVFVSLSTGNGTFATPSLALQNFGASPAAGGWASQNENPRFVADVNGDGRGDIVGFGYQGVYVSLNTGGAAFANPILASGQFGSGPAAGGWNSQDLYPRFLGDVNADGRADIVGASSGGVFYALGQADGFFGPQTSDLTNYGTNQAAGGWTSQDLYPRALGDVSGDGRADLVGFGQNSTYVSQSHLGQFVSG